MRQIAYAECGKYQRKLYWYADIKDMPRMAGCEQLRGTGNYAVEWGEAHELVIGSAWPCMSEEATRLFAVNMAAVERHAEIPILRQVFDSHPMRALKDVERVACIIELHRLYFCPFAHLPGRKDNQ